MLIPPFTHKELYDFCFPVAWIHSTQFDSCFLIPLIITIPLFTDSIALCFFTFKDPDWYKKIKMAFVLKHRLIVPTSYSMIKMSHISELKAPKCIITEKQCYKRVFYLITRNDRRNTEINWYRKLTSMLKYTKTYSSLLQPSLFIILYILLHLKFPDYLLELPVFW